MINLYFSAQLECHHFLQDLNKCLDKHFYVKCAVKAMTWFNCKHEAAVSNDIFSRFFVFPCSEPARNSTVANTGFDPIIRGR